MEVQLCEDSIFNIERCNWADEVEDSMELELLSNSTTGSEMSTTCSLKKSEPAVPLNLLRLGQQQRERVGLRAGCGRLGSSGSGKEEKKGGGGKKGKKSRGGRGDGKGCGGGGKERGRKKGGCDVEQSQNRGDLGSSCNTKAIHQYLLDCGGMYGSHQTQGRDAHLLCHGDLYHLLWKQGFCCCCCCHHFCYCF